MNYPSHSNGKSLWDKASRLIPGGNMLLTKNKNLYSPGIWPTYYSKAKGNKVWDLDGNQFIDFSTNGVGCCTLGHACDQVDLNVTAAISNGVMSSLNCPAEVLLAEELVHMNPWSGMVKFARSGGEANAIAIRIARAFSKRDKVAVCGYHGWHDWYLSTNLANSSNLNDHLLEGILPGGVPSVLAGYTIPLTYNNLNDLNLLDNPDIGVLKMEVERTTPPVPGYLETIRRICDEKNIVLIFDECTSGFRQEYGGLYKSYGIDPDMAVYGKALGNGYAITAVVGRSIVMNSALDSFISSTFWTEAIGPTAALSTLNLMKSLRSWETIPVIGRQVKNIWLTFSAKHDLPIVVQGIDGIPTFNFLHKDPLILKTVFVESMLSFGFLASTQFYPTVCHDSDDLSLYSHAIDQVFFYISDLVHSSQDLASYCKGDIAKPSFQRLN